MQAFPENIAPKQNDSVRLFSQSLVLLVVVAVAVVVFVFFLVVVVVVVVVMAASTQRDFHHFRVTGPLPIAQRLKPLPPGES